MADGFALIELNTEGKPRLKELSYFDMRLKDVCFEDAEGLEQLVDQLPLGLKDVLVLVMFNYNSAVSRSYEGEYDVEENFKVVSHEIAKENYKEFYRTMVTVEVIAFEEIKLSNADSFLTDFNEESTENNHCDNLVAEWEEFYEEDFEPSKIKSDKEQKAEELLDLFNK